MSGSVPFHSPKSPWVLGVEAEAVLQGEETNGLQGASPQPDQERKD